MFVGEEVVVELVEEGLKVWWGVHGNCLRAAAPRLPSAPSPAPHQSGARAAWPWRVLLPPGHSEARVAPFNCCWPYGTGRDLHVHPQPGSPHQLLSHPSRLSSDRGYWAEAVAWREGKKRSLPLTCWQAVLGAAQCGAGSGRLYQELPSSSKVGGCAAFPQQFCLAAAAAEPGQESLEQVQGGPGQAVYVGPCWFCRAGANGSHSQKESLLPRKLI